MNNKPVLWMDHEGNFWHEKVGYYTIPLYTHPAELTDEEWIITYQTWCLTSNDPLVLKKAILRKAQEK